MFSRILVAVDGSEQSLRAVDAAVNVAQRYDARLLILCVYRHHSPLESSLSMVRVRQQQDITPDKAMQEYAKEVVGQAKRHAAEAGMAEVEGYTKRGQPARAIVDFAHQHECDLIVLGSRGTGDSGGFFLGSVSHKVTGLSRVACLVIK